MMPRAGQSFLVATSSAAIVWALSPWLAGHREPWDAESYYYPVALVIAGAISGYIAPRPLWAHYVGAVVGQIAFQAIFLRIGPLFLLGVAFLLGYSLVFLLGATIGGRVLRRAAPETPPPEVTP
jgi:hypothetical protein